jgi:uncharacterized membrane protein
MMAVLAAISFVSSLYFVHIGAWPVGGFFGLDIGLLYLAFRLSYRSGRQVETIELAGPDLTVEKIGIRGEQRFWRFQAYWLRVRLIEAEATANRLLLSSHGRSLAIGGFLNAEERRDLAGELEEALGRWRVDPG